MSSVLPRFFQVVWKMNTMFTNYPRVKLVWALWKMEENFGDLSAQGNWTTTHFTSWRVRELLWNWETHLLCVQKYCFSFLDMQTVRRFCRCCHRGFFSPLKVYLLRLIKDNLTTNLKFDNSLSLCAWLKFDCLNRHDMLPYKFICWLMLFNKKKFFWSWNWLTE